MATFWENYPMNENTNVPNFLDDPAIEEADAQAVQRFLETGEPVDSAVAARVRARSDRAREANFKRVGFVNVQDYMRHDPDDE
jgi:hypothetical protein